MGAGTLHEGRHQVLRVGELEGSEEVCHHDSDGGECRVEGQQLPHQMGGLRPAHWVTPHHLLVHVWCGCQVFDCASRMRVCCTFRVWLRGLTALLLQDQRVERPGHPGADQYLE